MIRPFFSYYGGKWRNAVKLYPTAEHDVVVEPFAGSAGYAIRNWQKQVVLCDIDPVVAAVWRYLIRVPAAEILSIPDIGPDDSVDDLPICQEARYLVGFWLNRGSSRPKKRPSKWMRDGNRPGSFWGDRVRQTIARQVDLIRHWKVYCCSYEICPAFGPATWFIDPPYQVAGQHYRHGAAGLDYTSLGQWCRNRSGQVIVCENQGADWLPFAPLADVKTTRGGRSNEVYWTREVRNV